MSVESDDIAGEHDGELDFMFYWSAQELAEEVTAQALVAIESGLLAQGEFHLGLTGGTLGVEVSRMLVSAFNSAPEFFQGLHIWFSDERFVEANSPERNAAPLHGTLTNLNVIVHEALAPDSPATIDQATEEYRSALEGVTIDLNILGLGPDGHVASLFPGIADLDDQRSIFAITDSPKPPSSRISFTMKMINESREVWIIAAGESKVGAVAKVLEGDLSIPASHVNALNRTRLIIDDAAFILC